MNCNYQKITHCSLHHFTDASESGYGVVTYIRTVNEEGKIYCNLVMAKSRVAPLKFVSIPRLELTAAAIGTKIAKQLKDELDIKIHEERFWTDSKVVLAYIKNTKKRFKVFVANRLHQIRTDSDVTQWYYIKTDDNPADDCSRGLSMKKSKRVKRWFNGPEFLWRSIETWVKENTTFDVEDNDAEGKTSVNVNLVGIKNDLLSTLESRISCWKKLKRVFGYIILFVEKVKNRKASEESRRKSLLDVAILQKAEEIVLKLVQEQEFGSDIKNITHKKQNKADVLKNRTLQGLKPFIDNSGVMRVGGRLQNSSMAVECIHPAILPKGSAVSTMIVRDCHKRMAHSGRGGTMQEIRSNGYWIINCNALVGHVIYNCVICRSMRGKFGEKVMGNLPKDRVSEAPPFTYCGIDLFGPFMVKERRSVMKRYGALFTCIASRAVHIEVVTTMETDSFIMALRRMIARRGNVRTIRSDNGGNFIGADNELKRCFQEMDHKKIEHFLQDNGADWLIWNKNTPTASHMGGVWERQIRSARSILSSLLKTHGHSMNDESLNTMMTEVEAILNSRPLAVELLNDGSSINPICPSNILSMKSKVVMPPPGEFVQADIYCRKRWRRVQHIAEEFWSRWRKEFLVTLQERKKWTKNKRNFQVGDVVILKDDSQHRNHWPMALITKTHQDRNGDVRNVELKLGKRKSTGNVILERPISKIVLILESG